MGVNVDMCLSGSELSQSRHKASKTDCKIQLDLVCALVRVGP